MYEQIVAQIQQAIWSGELPAGASLPSLRRLARDLEVSLITTTRAYNDLAAAGRQRQKARRGRDLQPPAAGVTRRRRHPPGAPPAVRPLTPPPPTNPPRAGAPPPPTPAPRGSFVLPQDEGETRRRLLARLDAQLDDAVATARLAGIDLSEFHERSGQRWTATNKK